MFKHLKNVAFLVACFCQASYASQAPRSYMMAECDPAAVAEINAMKRSAVDKLFSDNVINFRGKIELKKDGMRDTTINENNQVYHLTLSDDFFANLDQRPFGNKENDYNIEILNSAFEKVKFKVVNIRQLQAFLALDLHKEYIQKDRNNELNAVEKQMLDSAIGMFNDDFKPHVSIYKMFDSDARERGYFKAYVVSVDEKVTEFKSKLLKSIKDELHQSNRSKAKRIEEVILNFLRNKKYDRNEFYNKVCLEVAMPKLKERNKDLLNQKKREININIPPRKIFIKWLENYQVGQELNDKMFELILKMAGVEETTIYSDLVNSSTLTAGQWKNLEDNLNDLLRDQNMTVSFLGVRG